MSMRSAALGCLLTFAVTAHAETPRLGQPLDDNAVARLPRSVFPDARGLPPGRGTVADGQAIFETKCIACHGKAGVGGSGADFNDELQALEGELAYLTRLQAIATRIPLQTSVLVSRPR